MSWQDDEVVGAPASSPWEKDEVVAPAAKEKPSGADRAAAAVAGANRLGVAGLLGLPVDTVENLANLVIANFGTAKMALGGGPGPDPLKGSFGGSEYIASLMEKAGIRTTNPRPDDAASRALYTGAGIAVSGIRPQGAKRSEILQAVRDFKPVLASAVGSASAQETLGPEWTGVGAMAPATMLQGAREASMARRTAGAEKIAANVETFEKAGAGTPTVGQATQSAFLQGLESLMSKFPGGNGIFRAVAERQQKGMGEKARTGTSAEDAGRAIEKGVDGFIARTKATWVELDDKVAQKVTNARAAVNPANTVKALDDLTKPVQTAEKSTAEPLDARVTKIKADLAADIKANDGVMSYDGLRAIRSRVGAQLDDALVTGAKGGELKKVYAALSKDLEDAAKQAGAGKDFARQNDFYRARMERIEGTLAKVIGKGKADEDIFKSFFPSDPDAATRVRAVMRSLEPAERQVVTQAVVARLGRAKGGKQDETGDVFSSETFLTNYNNLSPGAKAQIFPDGGVRESVDALAKTASNIREGSKVLANPSGSGSAAASYGAVGAAGTALVTGNFGTAAVIGSAPIGAYIGARMMTSPKVVGWLAQAPKVKEQNVAAHLARLGVIYNQSDEALKEELDRYMQSIAQR